MKKYDVGIYGLWYGNNYGSIITYYALSQVIESMGLSYAMIRNPLGRNIDIDSLDRSHPLRFAKEKYEITPLLKLSELDKLNEYFSAFLLGSDQMWNYHLSRPYKQSYFFDFVNDDKIKVSYATSFGKDTYIGPPEEKVITEKNLKRFDAISVRDDFSKRICENDFNVKAELVLDPVFLCPIEKYEQLIDEVSDFEIVDDYIFAYILDPNQEIGKALSQISDETNKKIIVVFNQTGDMEALRNRLEINTDKIQFLNHVTVKEWLYLYKNAMYVLTDSFHGTCFSIIFQKNFICLKNNGRGGSRFPFLLNSFGLIDHMINLPAEYVDKFHKFGLNYNIDYVSVNNIISKESERCYEWLKNALNKPKLDNTALLELNFAVKKTSRKVRVKSIEGVQVNCTGCGACAAVCPKSAIEMKENKEGFLNPSVDYDKCVDCSLCVKKCIDLNPSYNNNEMPKCYAMMANDEMRKISSSGGMFTVAANYILDKGGYVCGAAYKNDFTVEHILISDKSELSKLRGSKYMQSHVNNIYVDVKKLLDEGKTVLFTGMPCQTAGLYSYLGKDYDNLYTIDLLCHGITSSKVFEKYHQDVLNNKVLKRLEFKEKEPWGWHAGVNAYFEDGTKYSKPLESDMYFIAYLKSISKNTTCGVCKLNKLPRQGDMTMGDFWGINNNDPELYDGKGTSVVLANNSKGESFFDELKPLMKKWKEEPLEIAIQGNRIIKAPYKLHKNRKDFFANFDNLDFTSLTKGCFYNNLYIAQKNQLLRSVPEKHHELYYLAETAAKKSRGRKIITWTHAPLFEKILKQHWGLEVEFSVRKFWTENEPESVKPLTELKDSADKYYLVVLHAEYSEENFKMLESYGYREIQDYIFKIHKPVVLTNYDCSKGRYSDEYGNTIDGWNAVIGKIVFRGCNNHITLDKNIGNAQNLIFDLSSNSSIEIGENTRFNGPTRIEIKGYNGNSEIKIKNDCRFTDALIRLYNSPYTSSISINEKCSFETHLELHANAGKKIIIGRDCMFSHDIDLWAGDGHTIFDVNTGKNINSDYNALPDYKNQIVIGEHVWISKGAFIMHGTNIGNGSIVGAKSVVKGKYPNNCTIGGNPCSVIKTDIAWSRNMAASDMYKECGIENVNTTYDYKDKSKTHALVLGGTRFMGIRLVEALLEKGYDVTIATRGKHKDNFGSRVRRIKLDRLDENSVICTLSGLRFDVVFDTSAYTPLSVRYALKHIKCDRYIQVSSAAVYNGEIQVKKENMVNPYNLPYQTEGQFPYGERKKYAECVLCQEFENINSAIVRVPSVLDEENFSESMVSNRLYFYVEHIVKEIPFYEQNIDRPCCLIRTVDEADFLIYLAATTHNGVFNISSTGNITLRDIINYIEEKNGKKAIIKTDAEKNPFPFGGYMLDLHKVTNTGFKPTALSDWLFKLLDKYIEYCTNNDNIPKVTK